MRMVVYECGIENCTICSIPFDSTTMTDVAGYVISSEIRIVNNTVTTALTYIDGSTAVSCSIVYEYIMINIDTACIYPSKSGSVSSSMVFCEVIVITVSSGSGNFPT